MEHQRTIESQANNSYGSVIAFLKSDVVVGNMGEPLSFGEHGDDEIAAGVEEPDAHEVAQNLQEAEA